MNQRLFRRNVLFVIAVYAAALVGGVTLKRLDTLKDGPVYGTFKDLLPLIITIPAAWLSYCFQRRQAYLKDVRELWARMVGAVQDAIQYTHLSPPSQSDYGKTLMGLSCVTEELRAVFANLREEQGRIGLFPFESLKTIHGKISSLAFGGNFDDQEASASRKEIVDLWKKLRQHFLVELERDTPGKIDSPFIRD